MMFRQLLGSVSSTLAGGESAVWQHTFTVQNDNAHPALTVVGKDGVATESSSYAMIRRMTLTAEPGGLLMCEVELVGRKLSSTSWTPAYSADHIWKGFQGTIKLATSLSGLSGASAIAFHRLTLDFDPSLVQHHAFGSDTLTKNVNGTFKVTGELEILHEANTYRDYVKSGGERAMRISFAGDAIGNAEVAELEINLAKVAFREWTPSDGNDDLRTETIAFTAEYDMAEGSPQMINVVLTNEENTSAY